MFKFKEKLSMYDMIIANLIAGNSIIEPTVKLDRTQIAIGFSNIASESQITKYFLIRQFPDYLEPNIFDIIRRQVIEEGIKINFYTYVNPYNIQWDSAEMRSKIAVWRDYSTNISSNANVFDYRESRKDIITKERIIMSTKYLNEADLDYRRSLLRATFIITVTSNRDEASIINLVTTIKKLHAICNAKEIKIRELRVNMIDWLKTLGIFSLKQDKHIYNKLSKKILTDDLLANFNGYKQGRIGKTGIPLGIDVLAGVPVLHKFKADPDAAENWLISAESGGGKSYFVKSLLTYLLADGYVVTVMDYEGDEYLNLASYVKAGNAEDVKIVSMGKGSTVYFDPMEIADLTGDPAVDSDLMDNAINYTMSYFRIIVGGIDGDLSVHEERVISTAIQRVYDYAGVTRNKNTWYKSKGIRIKDVYEEIKNIVESKEFVDSDTDSIKHKAAIKIVDAACIYFEDGETKSETFKNPMHANELYKAKLIVFSFGAKGAGTSITDPIVLALKQLSVACISTQISNHCKYVKHCFNVKIWEEYQRWGEVKGSAEIITNAITGGRKRGDVNFIITNKISDILDDSNSVSSGLRQNIQHWAIGKIKDSKIRHRFCERFELTEIEDALATIAQAYVNDEDNSHYGVENRYRHSFCVILDNGKKAILKVQLPQSIVKSSLFRTGVDIKNG